MVGKRRTNDECRSLSSGYAECLSENNPQEHSESHEENTGKGKDDEISLENKPPGAPQSDNGLDKYEIDLDELLGESRDIFKPEKLLYDHS
jgi:hypothetical protein